MAIINFVNNNATVEIINSGIIASNGTEVIENFRPNGFLEANMDDERFIRPTSGFGVINPLWGGVGTVVKDAPTSEKALELADLNWNVVQEKICTIDGKVIPNYLVNIRDSDRRVLGMVTNRYKIVQNRDAFAFTDNLLGEGITYETAGALKNGKRVWLQARLEDRMITDELMSPYLVFTNTHDGTGAVRVAITPIRVICQNTLNLALKKAERHWACAHKGDIESKMEDAKRTLLNTEVYLHEVEEEFGELKLQTLTDDKVKEYVDLLLPYDEKDSARKIANVKEMREDLMNRYLYTDNLQYLEKSAYRFVNAVSDFATHREPNRRTEDYQANLLLKTADGNPLIDMAYKLVKTA